MKHAPSGLLQAGLREANQGKQLPAGDQVSAACRRRGMSLA
jgi:hypothetical protein